MRRLDSRLLAGLLLITGGVVYLLQNLGIITWGPVVWAGAFGVGGLFFLAVFGKDRGMWWALIPGTTLLGLAAVLGLRQTYPALAEAWGGSLFLGSIGVGFWLIYAADRSMWWAIVPGGVLVTLAVVAGLDQIGGVEGGGAFFLGLGLTFLVVAVLPGQQGRLRWAYFPAAALLVMGILLSVGWAQAIDYLWPAALIMAGLVLLTRALRKRA